MNNQNNTGFSIVEVLVGLLIGVFAIYATYAVYQHTESTQRQTSTVNDAQLSGLYTLFMVTQDVSNAGFAIMSNRFDNNNNPLLLNCPVDVNAFPLSAANRDVSLESFYPIPVAITPSEVSTLAHAPDDSNQRQFDILNIYFARPHASDVPLRISNAPLPEGINTFQTPVAYTVQTGDNILAVAGHQCAITTATNIVQTTDSSGNPVDEVTLNPVLTLTTPQLINLGQVVRRTYYVNSDNTLLMLTWDPVNGGAPLIEPIAAHIEFFRAQYGIDHDGNGDVDIWVSPDASGGNASDLSTIDWQAILPTKPGEDDGAVPIKSIKAIRLALVVRADEPDRALAGTPDWQTTLFPDCSDVTCKIPVTLPATDSSGAAGYRFRKYETVIPMQNVIWNNQ